MVSMTKMVMLFRTQIIRESKASTAVDQYQEYGLCYYHYYTECTLAEICDKRRSKKKLVFFLQQRNVKPALQCWRELLYVIPGAHSHKLLLEQRAAIGSQELSPGQGWRCSAKQSSKEQLKMLQILTRISFMHQRTSIV